MSVVLVIDHTDSFVWNLARYVAALAGRRRDSGIIAA